MILYIIIWSLQFLTTADVPPTALTKQHLGICPKESDITMPYSDETLAWIPFRDSCYLFVTNKEGWANAASNCKRFGKTTLSYTHARAHFML